MTLSYYFLHEVKDNGDMVVSSTLKKGYPKLTISCHNVKYTQSKKIVLVGAGASGKDFLKKKLREAGMNCDVSYTSRPKRNNEINGVDYNFISKEEFEIMIVNGELNQWNKFGNGHYYGTSNHSLDVNDVFVLTPNKIATMPLDIRKGFFVIFLDIPEHVRLERLLERGDHNEAERRIFADREDFDGFDDYDYAITNPEFDF